MDVVETVITKDDGIAVNSFGVLDFGGKVLRTTTYQNWDPNRIPGHVERSDDATEGRWAG